MLYGDAENVSSLHELAEGLAEMGMMRKGRKTSTGCERKPLSPVLLTDEPSRNYRHCSSLTLQLMGL